MALIAGLNLVDINNFRTNIVGGAQLLQNGLELQVNSANTDMASLQQLDADQAAAQGLLNDMLNSKANLAAQRSSLLQSQVNIGTESITLQSWIDTHPFEVWNYSNKIRRIEVSYTSFGIVSILLIYKIPTKASVTIGNVNNTNMGQLNIQGVDLLDDEWLMQIKITTSSIDTLSNILCKSISFYTNKNQEGGPPKITIPASSTTNVVINKTYYINPNPLTWLEHKRIAEAQGGTLACFQNSVETINTLQQLGKYQTGGSYYVGLYHTNALIEGNFFGGNRNSNWKWTDEDVIYNANSTNWNSNEPNNWGQRENVGQLYSNGTLNDIKKTERLSAIYQKKIVDTTTQTIRKNQEHIKNFTIKPYLSATHDFITSLDILRQDNAQSMLASTRQSIEQITTNANTIDESIRVLDESIAQQSNIINGYNTTRAALNRLNTFGNQYLNEISNNSVTENFFSPDTIEGMFSQKIIEGTQNIGDSGSNSGSPTTTRPPASSGSYLNALYSHLDLTTETAADLLRDINYIEDAEIKNSLTEFAVKKDNIFTNVLTDYILNDGKQNNFEDVYSKIDQENADKMRKIEINTYYDKTYKEYINILKVIIFACVILVPIVIANKNSLLPNNITNVLVIAIIFLTIIYIITKLVDIYMRDNKDFDKARIPYDREAAILQKSGVLTKKNNLLSSFSLTCIGADCCPESSGVLYYDTTKNRCVVNERYSNLDESMDGLLGNPLTGLLGDPLTGLLGNTPLLEEFPSKADLVQASLFHTTVPQFNAP
jgi:uncharacterized membrane protein (DUF485 family)